MDKKIRSIGRRKEAIAVLKMVEGTGNFFINNKVASDYLQNHSTYLDIQAILDILEKYLGENSSTSFDILVKVEGGGLVGQAEAIKLAVARAVCLLNSKQLNSIALKKILKDKGYLTQDARVKERRKYGLKKARKAPQYNKR